MNNKIYIILNILAVFLYWLQFFAGWSWPWLEIRQDLTGFKQSTGFAIFIFIFFQNILFVARSKLSWRNYHKLIYQLHFRSSIFSIPLLYLHTIKMGHQYTFFFSLAYSLNVLIASFAPKPFNVQNKHYKFYWMVSHVTLSMFISFFIFYHIFITFYFN
ncbi:hypothetical protein MNBD_NITROSPIRAE01-1363 [hydrothermal vent metagenome]|uniref:Ferric oxidoreductase domain-containing protein n=1 Tax=hydrothermal vent metagenome TaxID=652676 RepID=A0A3B1D6T8_9ZZZZ